MTLVDRIVAALRGPIDDYPFAVFDAQQHRFGRAPVLPNQSVYAMQQHRQRETTRQYDELRLNRPPPP